MQSLPALAHQGLAPPAAQGAVFSEASPERLKALAFGGSHHCGRITQAGRHEGTETLLAAHQIAKALTGFQL
jgi:hypothetical protein